MHKKVMFLLYIFLARSTFTSELDTKRQAAAPTEKFDLVPKEKLVETLAVSVPLQTPMILVNLIAQYCLEEQWIKCNSNLAPGIEVDEVAISGSGEYYALTSKNAKPNFLRLCNVHTDKTILERPTSLKRISLSHDGQYIVVQIGKQLGIWDAFNNQLTYKFSCGHYALSPNGKYVAFTDHLNQKTTIMIRDMATQKDIFSTKPSKKNIYRIACSPDGRYVAAACDVDIEIHDRTLGTYKKIPSRDYVDNIAFSPDATLLLTDTSDDEDMCCEDSSTTVWDIEKNEKIIEREHSARSFFLSDNSSILSIDNSKSAPDALTIWDIATGTILHKISDKLWIHTAAPSPCGKIILTINSKGKLDKWHYLPVYKADNQSPA